MKGQMAVTEIITIIGMIVVLVVLIPVILPFITKIIESFISNYPEIISKDLASLISTSVASTENIRIDYEFPSSGYSVRFSGRAIYVSREYNGEIQQSSAPILIYAKGSIPTNSRFIIEKRIKDGLVSYYVNSVCISGNCPYVPPEPPGPGPSPPPIEKCPGSFFTLIPMDCGLGRIDLLEYYIPDFAITNEIIHVDGSSNTEYFHTYLTNSDSDSGIFYTSKSRDPNYFEEFRFDKNYIYHMKDTTWATGPNQDVKCDNGDDAYFTLIDGSYGEDNCDYYKPEIDGGKLHPRCMSVGETTPTYELTVVGFSKKSCQCCKTPYVGNLPESITFVSRGEVEFPTGWSGDDVVELYKSSTRETYYYDKELGWVGFKDVDEGGNIIHSAYIKNTLPEVHCVALQCDIV